jgi:hypothetical protein
MVMARELYALLTTVAFCLPVNPGNAAVYVHPVLAGKPVNSILTLVALLQPFFGVL